MPWPSNKRLKKRKSTLGGSDLLRSVTTTLSAANKLSTPLLRTSNISSPNIEKEILDDVK